ncbi:ACP S-malonyltransferase [Enterobacteriaceae endosymbiont of Donacia tomentosa]|uniref:ACP S-malonyltransferase n=1 Tax=Enterobacteriaceae endosymbiont of Donacia tomentosa TaxID=2675787 RepID=UPI0014494854|nr:ACP S-malonyltransferase [Enterobacteriaceae endosymbiont of Donacia tomentosa]QJC31537.1 ACP S-malonyltransferase [Enterobacteriaceae endosymbiont of Donacia tomentosa]
MKPIKNEFKFFLNKITINKPKITFINNVDIKCEISPRKIKNALVKQLYYPINWLKCIKFIEKKNIFNIIEFSPKNILTKISKQIVNTINIISIYDQQTFLLALKKI